MGKQELSTGGRVLHAGRKGGRRGGRVKRVVQMAATRSSRVRWESEVKGHGKQL